MFGEWFKVLYKGLGYQVLGLEMMYEFRGACIILVACNGNTIVGKKH
jgi:hypothetical protein